MENPRWCTTWFQSFLSVFRRGSSAVEVLLGKDDDQAGRSHENQDRKDEGPPKGDPPRRAPPSFGVLVDYQPQQQPGEAPGRVGPQGYRRITRSGRVENVKGDVRSGQHEHAEEPVDLVLHGVEILGRKKTFQDPSWAFQGLLTRNICARFDVSKA